MNIEQQLEACSTLSELLSVPKHSIKAYVHIGGILGKTSTARFLTRIVRGCTPLTVGTFIHPPIISPQSCILVQDEEIGLKEYQDLQERVKQAVEKLSMPITAYEKLVMMAILAFQQHECDFIIVEAAFGGTFDATSILARTHKKMKQLAVVLSRIALDHVQFLGSSLAAITANITGIIRPSVPTILSRDQPAEVVQAVHDLGITIAPSVHPFGYLDEDEFFTRMPHHQQASNIDLAIRTFQLIAPDLGAIFGITCKTPPSGILAELSLPHTFVELCFHRRKFILDAAQNGDANLCLWLRNLPLQVHEKVHLVIGMAYKVDLVVKHFFKSLGMRPNYYYSFVRFSPPDGTPWIHSADRTKLRRLLNDVYEEAKFMVEPVVTNMTELSEVLSEDPNACGTVIIFGSPQIVSGFYQITVPREE